MKINLIPISHPQLSTIEIDNDEFLIGRMDESFVSLDAEITKDLSRQHAKIVIKNERISIIDLNSLNGTRINNQALANLPTPVNDGDIIEFAGCLAYKVRIGAPDLDATVLAVQKPELYLKLTPVNKASGLDILVITGFPFIISKEVGVFAALAQEFATEIRHISRQHAYIIVENNALKLVDISSTNSTFINSQQIQSDTPVTLKNGDIIAFAGDFFVYSVKLMSHHESIADTTVLSAATDKPNSSLIDNKQILNEVKLATTYASDPSPFLDILCEPIPEKNTAKKSTTKITNNTEKSPFFSAAFLQQCKAGLTHNKPSKSKKKFYYIFLSCIAILCTVAYFYFTDISREVTRLIRSGHNSDAAELAARSLKTNPHDEELLSLFNQATLNQLITDWLKIINQGQYQKAQQRLLEAKNNTLASQSLMDSINMLRWVGAVQQFMLLRNHQGGIEIFEDEKIMNDLLAFWHADKAENRKILTELVSNTPAFQPYYAQLLSSIRSLEHSRDVYLKAISRLESTVLQQLKSAASSAEILNSVTRFSQKYPGIKGLDKLKLDISHYAELNEALSNKDMLSLVTLRQHYQYKTPLFIAAEQQILTQRFPADEFSEQYLKAAQFWQTGDSESAIQALQKLLDSRWGKLAQDKLLHYQQILKAYKALQAMQEGSSEYVTGLFNFHSLLQQPEDHYFVSLIQKDINTHEQLLLEKARGDFSQAQYLWNEYTENNGIDGTLRLETDISDAFKHQAENLSSAFSLVLFSMQHYENMRKSTPVEVSQLYQMVKKELEKQRSRLIDLEFILSAKLLKEKLYLLTNAGTYSE